MDLTLSAWLKRPSASRRPLSRRSVASSFVRPTLDHLEDRVVMASPGSVALPIEVAAVNLVGTPAAPALDVVFSVAGQTLDAVPLVAAVTKAAAGVPILNLSLGPVDLNVLGLGVALDNCADPAGPVTVDVTAFPGQGILGDLLGGLGGGLNLAGILGKLDTLHADVDKFLDKIDDLLDGVLGSLKVTSVLDNPVDSVFAAAAPDDHEVCNILNLELQSTTLNLLGLQVKTSDICLDVTATEGEGILGDLLCGLAGGDGINLGGVNLGRILDQVDHLFDQIEHILDRVDDITHLDDKTIARLEKAVDKFENAIERLTDRVDDLKGVKQAVKQLDKVIDRLEKLGDKLGDVVGKLNDVLGQLESRASKR